MSALEQEIWQKLHLLDRAAKERIFDSLKQELEDSPAITLEEWLEKAEAFSAELRTKYGERYFFNSQAMLDELREEASWPRW